MLIAQKPPKYVVRNKKIHKFKKSKQLPFDIINKLCKDL